MRQVDTDALLGVAEALGVGNPASVVDPVFFDDENLQQVLEVSPLIRRARAGQIQTGGISGIQILQTHAGPGVITTNVNPYTTTWFAPALEDTEPFDIWVFAVEGVVSSAPTNFTDAAFDIFNVPFNARDGVAAPGVYTRHIVYWDDEISILGGLNNILVEAGTNLVTPRFRPFRVPRGASLRIRSNAAAASAYRFSIAVGIFPRGLGQDFAV